MTKIGKKEKKNVELALPDEDEEVEWKVQEEEFMITMKEAFGGYLKEIELELLGELFSLDKYEEIYRSTICNLILGEIPDNSAVKVWISLEVIYETLKDIDNKITGELAANAFVVLDGFDIVGKLDVPFNEIRTRNNNFKAEKSCLRISKVGKTSIRLALQGRR